MGTLTKFKSYGTLPKKKNTVTYKGQGYSVAPSKQKAFVKQQDDVYAKASERAKTKKKSSSKSSSKSSNVRELAKTVWENTLGTPTAQAVTTPLTSEQNLAQQGRQKATPTNANIRSSIVPTKLGRAAQVITDPLGLSPKITGTYGTEKPYEAMARSLGLSGLFEKQGGLVTNTGDTIGTVTGQNGQIMNVNPSNPDSLFYSEDPKTTTKNGVQVSTQLQDYSLPSGYQTNADIQNEKTKQYKPNEIYPGANQFDQEMAQSDAELKQVQDQIAQYEQELIAMGETPIDQMPTQQDLGGTRQTLASGALGNGAGLSGDPEMQAYVKSLQKSASGDFGAKDAKRQLEETLNGIVSQYSESQRLGENELNTAKTEDLNKLASLFAAYNTSDSEQRSQQVERTQGQYQTSLQELIAKLAAAKGQDITSAKNNSYNALQTIAEKKAQARQQVAQLIYQAQQDAAARNQKLYQSRTQASAKKTWTDPNTGDIYELS